MVEDPVVDVLVKEEKERATKEACFGEEGLNMVFSRKDFRSKNILTKTLVQRTL